MKIAHPLLSRSPCPRQHLQSVPPTRHITTSRFELLARSMSALMTSAGPSTVMFCISTVLLERSQAAADAAAAQRLFDAAVLLDRASTALAGWPATDPAAHGAPASLG